MNLYINKKCGELMVEKKRGIYRKAKKGEEEEEKRGEMGREIEKWKNKRGEYVLYNDESERMLHEILKVKTYMQISSPIRRLVDVLNQVMMIMCKFEMSISKGAKEFVEKWLGKIEYINSSMRSIRKVQNDCELMSIFVKNPEICEKKFEGVVFDKMYNEKGEISYMVYISELKKISKVRREEGQKEEKVYKIKMYYFGDEYNNKKKVRMKII